MQFSIFLSTAWVIRDLWKSILTGVDTKVSSDQAAPIAPSMLSMIHTHLSRFPDSQTLVQMYERGLFSHSGVRFDRQSGKQN